MNPLSDRLVPLLMSGTILCLSPASSVLAKSSNNPADRAFQLNLHPSEVNLSAADLLKSYQVKCGGIKRKVIDVGEECQALINVVKYCQGDPSAKTPALADIDAAADSVQNYDGEEYECFNSSQEKLPSPTSGGSGDKPALISTKWQQDLVGALAAFLSKRAEAEALAWAGEQFAGQLCEGKDNGSTLFPGTCAILGSNAETTTLSWSAIRQGALDDFRSFAENVITWWIDRLEFPNNPGISQEIRSDFSLGLATAVMVTRNIIGGEDPRKSLVALSPFVNEYVRHNRNVAKRTRLADILWLTGTLADLYSTFDGQVNGENLRHAMRLIQKMYKEQAGSGANQSFVTWLDNTQHAMDLIPVIRQIQLIAAQAKAISDGLSEAKIDDDQYSRFLENIAVLFERSSELYTTISAASVATTGMCGKTQKTTILDNKAITVLRECGTIVRLVDSLRRQEYGAAFARFSLAASRLSPEQKMPTWYSKWVPFLADLATAKDSETMEGVLRSAAAPVGSYKIKRGKPTSKSSFHAMLNAYVGVSSGAEALLNNGKTRGHIGPTASIGVEGSWGKPKDWSVSLYLPILDLGSLVDYRLGSDDDVESAPTLGFAQVLSPGLFFVVGVPKAPVAFAFGGQIAPELRKSIASTGDVERFSVVQLGAFLAVDIPLLIFR